MERPGYFGNLPFPPKNKKPCVIRDADQKKDFFSHEVPEESNVYTVIASTDKLHCGMMAMAPGSTWSPRASSTSAALASPRLPNAATRPRLTPISASPIPFGVTQIPPFTIRSKASPA